MRMKCPACGEHLDFENPEEPKISNLASVSLAVVEHPVPVTCRCGQSFVAGIVAIQRVVFAPVPVQLKAAPLIVVPK